MFNFLTDVLPNFFSHLGRWKIENGECERLVPMVHKSQVSSLAVAGEDVLVSTAWDDTIAFTNSVTNTTGQCFLL